MSMSLRTSLRSPLPVLAAALASVPRPARDGLRDGLSVVVGYIPFAVALGAALASSGVVPWVAWASSPLVVAGGAQLVTVQMLGAGADALVVVVAALVVNARHVLYSASMTPYVAGWRRRDRWLAAYPLADPVFALAAARLAGSGADVGEGESSADRRRYYLAASATCWLGWLILTGAGAALADVLPAGLRLDVAAPLTFLILLLPSLRQRPAWVAAAVGGGTAVLASGLPLGLGLLAGTVAGVVAGSAVRPRGGADDE